MQALAATAAQCARLYAPYDAAFANQCRTAAATAYAAAEANPTRYASPQDGNGGGAYSDGDVTDEQVLAEYDALYAELVAIERENPHLVSGESPTQTVGGERSEMFEPVEHLQRMYSLDNAFDADELGAWLDRVEAGLGSLPDLLCELKIDGLALNLRYERGVLVSAATRGDADLILFPELFICGYPPEDLVLKPAESTPISILVLADLIADLLPQIGRASCRERVSSPV